jgi:hypothetical protein
VEIRDQTRLPSIKLTAGWVKTSGSSEIPVNRREYISRPARRRGTVIRLRYAAARRQTWSYYGDLTGNSARSLEAERVQGDAVKPDWFVVV